MNAPILKVPTRTCWQVETSFLTNLNIQYLHVDSLKELRRRVQQIATKRDQYLPPPQHKFGEISFRYEADANDEVSVVHSYFVNRHGNATRFIRLKRTD